MDYTIGIATMTQNQASRLKEWILYHYNMGFNKFIIYLDKCTDNSKTILENLIIDYNIDIDIYLTEEFSDKSIFNIHWVKRSHYMYTNTINKYKDLNWIAFIEVDEFILPQLKDFNLKLYLQKCDTKCIYVNSWDFKGPFDENKPILGQSYECWTDEERYNNGYKWIGKSIIKPSHFLKCMDAHHFMQIDNTVSKEFKYERNLLQVYHGKEVYIDDTIMRICHYRNHTPFSTNYIAIKDKIVKNICIIGGGWYGCYIAEYLLEHFNYLNITILDEKNDIFEGSSSNNQNRLHLGFHYPKCDITKNKCKLYYTKFVNKYKEVILPINKNYYVISSKSSINYDNYIKLYDINDYTIIENKLFTNIDNNIINTKEMYIDFNKVKTYFKTKFTNKINFIFNYKVNNLNNSNGEVIINNDIKFDKVFNCTYNQLNIIDNNIDNNNIDNNDNNNIDNNVIYEKCLTLLYKKKENIEFDCLTIMDGEFSSLYFYKDDLYTLTNVKHTPLIKSNKFEDIQNYNTYNLQEKIYLFEQNIIEYYPYFKENFEYYNFFESFKCKNNNNKDDNDNDKNSRDININIKENIFNAWCGKISLVFNLDKHIDKFI